MQGAAEAMTTRWSVLALGFMAGVVGMFQTAKMSVSLTDVQADVGLSLVGASWGTTIVSLVGALFGVLAGRLCEIAGLVRALVAALVITTIAGLATAAASDPVAFMLARTAEGFGYLFVCTASPALMAAAAAPRDRGLALAIWGAFVPVSVSIMSIIGPMIDAAAGWRMMFAASALSAAVVAVAVRLMTRDPAEFSRADVTAIGRAFTGAPALHLSLYRQAGPVGLAVAFMTFAALQVGIIALLPTYLITVIGHDGATAGLVLSAITPFAFAGTAIAGFCQRFEISDRSANVICYVIMIASGAGLYLGSGAVPMQIVNGAIFFTAGGVIGSLIFGSLPRRTGALGVGLFSGLIVQFGNIGALLGAPILAATATAFGWHAVPVAVAIMALIGIAGTLVAR